MGNARASGCSSGTGTGDALLGVLGGIPFAGLSSLLLNMSKETQFFEYCVIVGLFSSNNLPFLNIILHRNLVQ